MSIDILKGLLILISAGGLSTDVSHMGGGRFIIPTTHARNKPVDGMPMSPNTKANYVSALVCLALYHNHKKSFKEMTSEDFFSKEIIAIDGKTGKENKRGFLENIKRKFEDDIKRKWVAPTITVERSVFPSVMNQTNRIQIFVSSGIGSLLKRVCRR